MEKQIEFTDRTDDVESKIVEGQCEDCDQDPMKCLLQGYCQYEKELDEQ